MSLRGFHLFFILTCVAMFLFVGVLGIRHYQRSGDWGHVVLGAGAFILGAGLLWYLSWFLRKSKAEKSS